MLKIDLQGYEPAVLAGACGVIDKRAIQTVFFELNSARKGSFSCSA